MYLSCNERSRVWLVPKRRYPALNRVSVRRKLKGEISKRRMTQNVVENCWKTAARWLASGRDERVFALLLRYNLTLHHHGETSGTDIIQSVGEEGRYSRQDSAPALLRLCVRSLDREPISTRRICNVAMANKRIDFACFAADVSRSFVPLRFPSIEGNKLG